MDSLLLYVPLKNLLLICWRHCFIMPGMAQKISISHLLKQSTDIETLFVQISKRVSPLAYLLNLADNKTKTMGRPL